MFGSSELTTELTKLERRKRKLELKKISARSNRIQEQIQLKESMGIACEKKGKNA